MLPVVGRSGILDPEPGVFSWAIIDHTPREDRKQKLRTKQNFDTQSFTKLS